jgi:6-pyruvoyltetrahydropterin/6-carboxytetrahydropterin synthase
VSVLRDLVNALRNAWPGTTLDQLTLSLSPFLSLTSRNEESPMVRLSEKFEFSASHRLFRQDCDDAENRRLFGKCSNPNGHGHNYELQVTLAGEGEHIGRVLKNLPDFERIVGETVIERFDHKNLNVDVPEFADLIPSVENIARVIYRLLSPRLSDAGAKLAAVTVWETPKTWCEYSE